MSKVPIKAARDDMRPEYDFTGGVRGKWAARYAEGTNVVLLDPDVAAMFPDSKAVNRALRVLVELASRDTTVPTHRVQRKAG
jgi:hypothetical protein